jgi:hypothetical protein
MTCSLGQIQFIDTSAMYTGQIKMELAKVIGNLNSTQTDTTNAWLTSLESNTNADVCKPGSNDGGELPSKKQSAAYRRCCQFFQQRSLNAVVRK